MNYVEYFFFFFLDFGLILIFPNDSTAMYIREGNKKKKEKERNLKER